MNNVQLISVEPKGFIVTVTSGFNSKFTIDVSKYSNYNWWCRNIHVPTNERLVVEVTEFVVITVTVQPDP